MNTHTCGWSCDTCFEFEVFRAKGDESVAVKVSRAALIDAFMHEKIYPKHKAIVHSLGTIGTNTPE